MIAQAILFLSLRWFRYDDVEYSWNQDHEDLIAAKNVPLLVGPGQEAYNPKGLGSTNHGTAVLGEMIGTDNVFGIKGISHAAEIGLAPEMVQNTTTNETYQARADAICLAMNDGKPGDVILLEMQTSPLSACGIDGCGAGDQTNCGPAELNQDVWDATKTAVGNGRVVVAAGGNGSFNLDDPDCGGKWDRSSPNFKDSGAIIVGAGGSGFADGNNAREKLSFSSYGSRFDVQGWGETIYTAGYGDAYSGGADNTNTWYTDSFSGTSGASPIVAAAAANL